MNDDLIYKVADAFKTDLFHVGSDVRGLITDHKLDIGGLWKAKTDITIIVDENSENMVTAMARIFGNLWSYFIATKEGTWVIFFDGSRVKLHPGAEREFGLGNARNSLKKLKPSITRVFQMIAAGETKVWESVDLSVTDFL